MGWLDSLFGSSAVAQPAGAVGTTMPAVPSYDQAAADAASAARWRALGDSHQGVLGRLFGGLGLTGPTSGEQADAFNRTLGGAQQAETGRLGLQMPEAINGILGDVLAGRRDANGNPLQGASPQPGSAAPSPMPPSAVPLPPAGSSAGGAIPGGSPVAAPAGGNSLLSPPPGMSFLQAAIMRATDPVQYKARVEAPYQAMNALLSQAGRAVKIEPGDSVTTGFGNLPPQISSQLQRFIGNGQIPAQGGGMPAAGGMPGGGSGGAAGAPGVNATGFPTQPTSEGGRLQSPLTLQGATMQKTVLPEQYKVAADHYQAAQGMMGQLDMLDRGLDELNQSGWSSTGTGANTKMSVFKSLNGVSQLFGGNAVFDPAKIATWEDMNKESTRMGFELAKTLGSREAQMIVQQAVSAVPNVENTYLGGKLVSSSLRQAAQRQSDYYEYLTDYAMSHGGQTMGADVQFNKTHPVGGYVKAAVASAKQATANAAPAAPAPTRPGPSGLPSFTSPTDQRIMMLPPGAHFLDANGVERVRP
jgi:hypothetical protein